MLERDGFVTMAGSRKKTAGRPRRGSRRSRILWGCLAAVLLVGVQGCGSESANVAIDPGDGPVPGVTPGADAAVMESATPRGLAAVLLGHLGGFAVNLVGGDEVAALDQIHVSVITGSSAIGAVNVVVSPSSGTDERRCGSDSGYILVSCKTSPAFQEIVALGKSSAGLPVLIGKYSDGDRGDVIAELFGTDTPTSRAFLRALISDPLLGVQTSKSMNQQGEKIANFTTTETRGFVISGGKVEGPTVPQRGTAPRSRP